MGRWSPLCIALILIGLSGTHAQQNSSAALVFPYLGCGVRQDPKTDAPYLITAITMPRVDRMCVYLGTKSVQKSSPCGQDYAASLEMEINTACAGASHIIAMAGGNMLDLTFHTRRVAGAKRPKTVLTVSGTALTTCLGKGCKICFYLIGACTTIESMTRDVKGPSFALVDKSRTCCTLLTLNTTELAAKVPVPSSPTQPALDRSLVVNNPSPSQLGSPPKAAPSPGAQPRPLLPSPVPQKPAPSVTPLPSPRRNPILNRNLDTQCYNLVLGTQQFSPTYGFTNQSQILEAADAILAMGSNLIKMHTDVSKYARTVLNTAKGLSFNSSTITLKDIFSQQPDMKAVLDMPRLKYYMFWAIVRGHESIYRNGFQDFAANKTALQTEYKQVYDAALYLLKRYQGSGKTFFFGNWEGDWMLKNGLSSAAGPAGMIAWVNTRQAAIDAAKASAKASGVEVYLYLEVNLVEKAINNTKFACAANLVLPNVTVDFCSYSCYDSIMGSGPPRDVRLKAALSLLQSRLKPRVLSNGINPGTPAPYESRVFVGEYGFATSDHWPGQGPQFSMKQALDNTKQVIQAALEMKSPFILYWQLFNNQLDAKGNAKGWWLITDKGVKTPMYSLHKRFLASAKSFVSSHKATTGNVPSRQQFNEQALAILKNL